jgi:hypothetical protein
MVIKVNKKGDWIEVMPNCSLGRGTYLIEGCNFLKRTDTRFEHLCFTSWRSTVEDLDQGHSDLASSFGGSLHLRWKDVEFDLSGPDTIKAPNLKRIKEAVKHVTFGAWDTDDV